MHPRVTTSAVEARSQRVFGPDSNGEPRSGQAPYLVTIDTLPMAGAKWRQGPCVQAWAAIDDFGDLVAVEAFQ